MGGPSGVFPSVCQAQFDAFIIYPDRGNYPQIVGGDAAYDKAMNGYQKATAAIGECISKNTSCKYSEGMYDSLMLQFSNLSRMFEELKKHASAGDGKLCASDIEGLGKLFKTGFWRAVFKCRRDIAENLRRFIKERGSDELASLMASVKEGKPSPVNEEVVRKFEHVTGNDRKLLILFVEAAYVDEEGLAPFFPKPGAPAPVK